MEEIIKLEHFFMENKDIFEDGKYEKAINILSEIKNEIEDYEKNSADAEE